MTVKNEASASPREGAPPFAFPTARHPEEAEKVRARPNAQPGEDQLDDAISQSFPASDPVSVTVSPVPKDEAEKKKEAVKQAVVRQQPAILAAALVSTAVLGVGAALLWGRHRRAQQPRALLAEGLRGAWTQAGRQVQKARKQGLQEHKRVQRLIGSLQR